MSETWWAPDTVTAARTQQRQAHLLDKEPTTRRPTATSLCGQRRRTWTRVTRRDNVPRCPDCEQQRGDQAPPPVANLNEPIPEITPRQNRQTVWLWADYCARTGQDATELGELIEALGLDARAARGRRSR